MTSDAPPHRATRRLGARGAGRTAVGAALVVLAGLLAPSAFARGEKDGPTAADFDGVVAAWRARDAQAVVRFVPRDGRLTLYLEGTGGSPVTGRASQQNAQAILAEYFEDVGRVALVDASPADSRTWSRVYDYTYRPKRGEARTTNLTFTLSAGDGGRYALVEISERQRAP